MKFINKSYFTTFITALICTIAIGQSDVRKVAIGIYGSANTSWLKPDIDGKYGFTRKGVGFGYSGNVGFEFALFNSNNYAFVTGVGILYHTGKLEYPDIYEPTTGFYIPGTTTTKYKASYVDIPIILKLKTNEIGYLTYYGEVGTSVGINYKSRADWNGTYDNGSYTEAAAVKDKDVSLETNILRIPLVIGAGVEYNLSGNTSMVIGLVYNNGFTNFFAWGKNNPKIYDVNDDGSVLLDANNNVILDVEGNPQKLDIKRKAISNSVGLKVGIKF